MDLSVLQRLFSSAPQFQELDGHHCDITVPRGASAPLLSAIINRDIAKPMFLSLQQGVKPTN